MTSALTFGIADTNCAIELASMHVDKQWRQPRGPKPPEEVQINMCCFTLFPNGGVVFEWNGCRSKRLRTAAPVAGTELSLSFGVPEGKFEVQIGATNVTEKFGNWARAIDPKGQHFAFLAVESDSRPTIVAKPMLSVKRTPPT